MEGRRRAARDRRPVLVAAVVMLLAGLACGGGSGGKPTTPPRSVFGAVGGSLTRLAIAGYNSIGGSRGWPDGELAEYGGASISVWAREIGQPGARTWSIFQGLLEAESGTDQIWWHILVRKRSGPPPAALSPADQQMVLEVGEEIRRRVGPGMPIYASPIPLYAPAVECEPVSPTDERISQLMVDFAVARGLAERGPTLRPITNGNNNGPSDPCHQGPLGREQHGRELRAFFGG